VPTSPSSSVQAARKAIAERLREMRLDAGLTGRELAKLCGWHPSKASRLENAKAVPSNADIRAWCRVCGAEDQLADVIAASRTADSMYVEWRRLHRSGLRAIQESAVPLYERTRLFRAYSSRVVPGFLQTRAYATALLSTVAAFRETPNDVEDAVQARLDRSRVLHEGGHRFVMIVEESALRYRIGDAETMAAQLGHLLEAMTLPSVSLGVIPFTASRSIWPVETFNIFDTRQVGVEQLSAKITITAPSEIRLYLKAFSHFVDMAVHGAKARRLITAAISALE
jgi:transcriptional regulator with XRE-family HTH domain